MANRIDLPIAYFGILRGGMVAVPINPRSTTSRDRAHDGRLADPGRAGRRDRRRRRCARRWRPAWSTSPSIIVNGTAALAGETAFDAFLSDASGTAPAAPPDAETLAVILYTSGSSGKPRGAMLTHRALLANIEQVASLKNPPMGARRRRTRPAADVPRLRTQCGARPGRSPGRARRADRRVRSGRTARPDRGRGHHQPPAGSARHRRVDRPLRSAREARGGAHRAVGRIEPRPRPLRRLHRVVRDCSSRRGTGSPRRRRSWRSPSRRDRERTDPPKPGSVGRPLPGIEVRIIETALTPADVRRRSAASGDPAQIWVRGANLFSGYWPDGVDGPDDDGWYATGDIGLIDGDGDLMIVDRLRELVIVSGLQRLPVRGRGRHRRSRRCDPGGGRGTAGRGDRRGGRRVRRGGARIVDREVLVESIEARCRTRLARFKQPSAHRRSSRGCLVRPPARSRRVGCARWPGPRRWASTSDERAARRRRSRRRVLAIRLPPVRRGGGGGGAGVRRRRCGVGRGSTSTTTRTWLVSSPSRCRSPSSTAASTTSGGSILYACGRRCRGTEGPRLHLFRCDLRHLKPSRFC